MVIFNRDIWTAVFDLAVFFLLSSPIVVIATRAGFSSWVGWMMGMANLVVGFLFGPPGAFVTIAILFFLAIKQWPVNRQLPYAKLRAGFASEGDAYDCLEQALALEKKGRYLEAAERCVEVLEKFQETPPGKDAAIALERLKGKSAMQGGTRGGPG
jgi:hypothetical protein